MSPTGETPVTHPHTKTIFPIGWVERSETHRSPGVGTMSSVRFAALYPPYGYYWGPTHGVRKNKGPLFKRHFLRHTPVGVDSDLRRKDGVNGMLFGGADRSLRLRKSPANEIRDWDVNYLFETASGIWERGKKTGIQIGALWGGERKAVVPHQGFRRWIPVFSRPSPALQTVPCLRLPPRGTINM